MCTFWLNNGRIVFDCVEISTYLVMAHVLFSFLYAEVYFIKGKITLLDVDDFMCWVVINRIYVCVLRRR